MKGEFSFCFTFFNTDFFKQTLSPSNLFYRFCFERGYLLESSAKGDHGKLENYRWRPYNELWTEGMEPLPVPDWQLFRNIWKKYLPKVRI